MNKEKEGLDDFFAGMEKFLQTKLEIVARFPVEVEEWELTEEEKRATDGK